MSDVNIYYFDEHGKYMVMASKCPDMIQLPIIIRYYERFESSTSQIGNYNDIPLDYNKHKKDKEKFTWYKLTLTKRNNDGEKTDWSIEGLNDPGYISPEAFPIVNRELQSRFSYWFNKHCDIRTVWKHPETYHLGHTCYWKNPVVRDISNITAHIYGHSVCLANTLKNVILIVHDKLDIIGADEYGKYKDQIFILET